MKPYLSRILVVLVFAVASAGCFGVFGGGSDEPEQRAVVVVSNDLSPSTLLTVGLRAVVNGSEGETVTIGTVAAGQERSLEHTAADLQGTYQLTARQSNGASVVSRQFTLFDGARVEWQVSSNRVTVTESR